MEDVLTEAPPPSRFFQEDLDAFAAPAAPLPPPLLLFSPSKPTSAPKLLIVFISPPSLSLLHRLPSKPLSATLLLPEIPLAPHPLLPSPRAPSCHVYSHPPALLAAVLCSVPPDRARAVAKALVGGIKAERVVVLDSLRGGTYRGRLAADEPLAFKLETSLQRRSGEPAVRGVRYLPSGSVADGLGAAVLAECEMRRIRGTMVLTWPDHGWASPAPILKAVMKDLGLEVGGLDGEDFGSAVNSDLYT